MYETIIVPVDVNNTEKASDMLKAAERLGGKNAKVVLLNVIEAVPNYVAVHLPEEFKEQVRKKATDGLSRIAKSTSLETEIEVRGGHASAEILTVADERNADAIIIASHRIAQASKITSWVQRLHASSGTPSALSLSSVDSRLTSIVSYSRYAVALRRRNHLNAARCFRIARG